MAQALRSPDITILRVASSSCRCLRVALVLALTSFSVAIVFEQERSPEDLRFLGWQMDATVPVARVFMRRTPSLDIDVGGAVVSNTDDGVARRCALGDVLVAAGGHVVSWPER